MRKVFKKIIYRLNLFSALFYLLRIMPVKKNKILFECSYGRSYGDSPKAIYEYLKKNVGEKFTYVWISEKNCNDRFPKDVKTVQRDSFKYILEHVTSAIWISNVRKPGFVRKRKTQFYIQTWHAPLGIKRIEKDAVEFMGPQGIKNSINDGQMTDLMICGSDFRKKVYEESFWYDGPVLKIGTPRCDLFFHESAYSSVKKSVYQLYRLDESKPTLLYAPTFRLKNSHYFEHINFENFSKNYNCLYRFHFIENANSMSISKGIDATSYPDMQELLIASDILITDFSSSMFDMLIAKKKCVLFVPDLEDYLEKERKTYFDIRTLPFPLATNMEELNSFLVNFDDNKYYTDIEQFTQKVGMEEDGNSCKRLLNFINDRFTRL